MSGPALTGVATKVLFFGEGATLAHVARPLTLARTLSSSKFDVVMARPLAFQWMTSGANFKVVDLACQDSSTFALNLQRGLPLFDFATLDRYVEDDLRLIESERPDVIVGDFRLSLSVSARLRSIPYITICDAYWGPEYRLDPPLPVMAFTRFVPVSLAAPLFRLVAPIAFRLHAIALERLRAKYRLPSLGFSLQRCYTDADLRLYANIPSLFPEVITGEESGFIGPIAWSPEDSHGFADSNSDDSVIYLTMGSSGDPEILGKVIPVLESFGKQLIVATGGRWQTNIPIAPHTKIFDFVPGELVCQRASMVVCNGGSPVTNQALACGVPVLGIARNMDQFLNMRAIEKFGAGITLRADRVRTRELAAVAANLIENAKFTSSARILAESARIALAENSLAEYIDRLLAAACDKSG